MPDKHVDTGMGFERLVRVLQKKQSNYDSDVFQPLIRAVESIAQLKYGQNEKQDIAFRVIADHIRAIAFTIADGQLPSNNGAGYVIRRILRRAVRYAYSYLDIKEPFLYSLVAVLGKEMGDFFPEIISQKDLVTNVIREEESQFLRTLDKGIQLFNNKIKELKTKTFPGDFAFTLYDTFGFPIDLTSLMAREQGFEVDIDTFETHLQEQKNRSKQATKLETEDWIELKPFAETLFVGYDADIADVHVLKYRKISAKGKEMYQLVLDKTPFYAEGGGQVGDTGVLRNGHEFIHITDTKKENNLVVHFTEEVPHHLDIPFTAEVNASKRNKTRNNHSATHLLHQALREILGTHVEQKGSLVNDEYLRFDFSHFQKITEDELFKIEEFVNDRITEAIKLEENRAMEIQKAKELGAMALFGEKYGDRVRVIKFGHSVELCGGLHVANTASIGIFKIISEGSVAAGVRRIEALTARKALDYLKEKESELATINAIFKNPKELKKSIEDVLAQNEEYKKQLEQLYKEKAHEIGKDLQTKGVLKNEIQIISSKIDLPSSAIRDLVFQLKNQEKTLVVIGQEADGKANISVGVSDDLVKAGKFNAGNIIKELAKEIDGGGGGQAFYATAGGKKTSGIALALKKIFDLV